MKGLNFLFLLVFLPISSFSQDYTREELVGDWIGEVDEVVGKNDSLAHKFRCNFINVSFKLRLFENNTYDLLLIKAGSEEVADLDDLQKLGCRYVAEAVFEQFKIDNQIKYTTWAFRENILSLNFKGLSRTKLKHIHEEAKEIEVIKVDANELKVRISLKRSKKYKNKGFVITLKKEIQP